MTVGQRIKELRETKDISQNELAKRANIAQSSLSYIEKDAKAPSTSTIKMIADALDVPQAYLLGEVSGESNLSLSPKLNALLDIAQNLSSEKLSVLIETAKAMCN